MRVLFITGEFPPMQGGVGDCTNEIAKALVRLKVEAHVVTSTGDKSIADGASAEASNWVEEGGVHVRRAISSWSFGVIPYLKKTIRELDPAVIHIQYQTGAYGMHPAIDLFPWALARKSHPPLVTTFHDLRVPYLFPKAGPVREWVTRLMARTSDAVISTNGEDLRQLSTWNLRNLSLIPIGSNIPTNPPSNYDRTAWRARLGVGPDSILISYFGFLNGSKGGETLIRALALLPDVKLIMVGGQVGASDPTDRAYLAKIKSLIGELRLAPRVLWTDYTPAAEVSANLLASDICVLPYRDGASFRRGSLMAAIAHGLPIVTTESREAPDPKEDIPSLHDGENVLLVPPDEATALARAVGCLVDQPELRSKLSQGARELSAFFTWDKIARQHLELYKNLTGGAP